MQTISITILVLLLSPMPAPAAAEPTGPELNFVFSPFYRPEEGERISKTFYEFIVSRAEPGTTIVCWDTYNLVTIATFEIPKLRFDSSRARFQKLTTPLGQIQEWFARARTNHSPAGLQATAMLNVPGCLEQIAVRPARSARAVALIGSPFYHDVREPTFNTDDGRYPSDAHLSTTADQSPFAVAGQTNRLAATLVHWVYASEQLWRNEPHRAHVRRFWTCWIAAQGGRLVKFDADLNSLFGSMLNSDLPAIGNYVVDPTAKLEMRSAVAREIPVWMPQAIPATNGAEQATNPASPPVAAATTNRVALAPPVAFPLTAPPATAVGIGLMWPGRCDLDLYVRPRPADPELSFRNTVSPQGYYHHDFRDTNIRGTPGRLDYEYVEVKIPVDIRNVDAWINYYSGTAATPSGVVVVWYHGQQFTADFTIPATSGNRGADPEHRAGSPNWVRINLRQIVGLPE